MRLRGTGCCLSRCMEDDVMSERMIVYSRDKAGGQWNAGCNENL